LSDKNKLEEFSTPIKVSFDNENNDKEEIPAKIKGIFENEEINDEISKNPIEVIAKRISEYNNKELIDRGGNKKMNMKVIDETLADLVDACDIDVKRGVEMAFSELIKEYL
jgi:hypothetical protein